MPGEFIMEIITDPDAVATIKAKIAHYDFELKQFVADANARASARMMLIAEFKQLIGEPIENPVLVEPADKQPNT